MNKRRKNILSVNFSKHSFPNLVAKSRHIVSSLKEEPGITYFPITNPSVAVLAEATELLAELMSLEMTPSNLQARNAQRIVVVDLLHDLAADLEEKADGDMAMLSATGYNINRIARPYTSPPGMPQNVRVKRTGTPGEAISRCDLLAETSFYESMCSLHSQEGPFIMGATSTSTRKGAYSGLERGKDYYFRMRGVNSQGPGPWSDVTVMMVV